jgi:hypothetical protein
MKDAYPASLSVGRSVLALDQILVANRPFGVKRWNQRNAWVEDARASRFELAQIIHATKNETVRNLKTAKVRGLDVPAAVFPRAEEVIQFR